MEYIIKFLPPRNAAEAAAFAIVKDLVAAGYQAYTVGGAVRDRLLSRPPVDVDVATNATPGEVAALFPKTIAVGVAFGVMIVVQNGVQTEVATFRTDGDYHDHRHPDSVCFSDPEHDAQRRDFTINALFYDPEQGSVIDYVGGLNDLARGCLQAIGNAADRFNEDALRMLRAVRFAAQLDFNLARETADAIRRHAAKILAVSPERIFAELSKILCNPRADHAFEELASLDLLRYVLPEVAALQGVEQPPRFHPEGDVWQHTLLMLRGLRDPSLSLAWATLLHDIGKPETFQRGADGVPRFPNHACAGGDRAYDILQRLHASRRLQDEVATTIHWHMSFADVQAMRRSTLRRMLHRPTLPMELELHRLDCRASHDRLQNYAFVLDAVAELQGEPAVPEPLLSGRDILNAGIPQGPFIGELLQQLQELQLNGELNTREDALGWLQDTIRTQSDESA